MTLGRTDLPVGLRRWDPDPATGCWIWRGWKNPEGYGSTTVARRTRLAHRAMYELLVGPIPEGLQIDHLCRTRDCVNPDHLEPVTARENTLRSNAPTAKNARKTHCPKGHPYDEANTYVWKRKGNTHRRCKACHSALVLRSYYEKRAS
jgi:hypothetical protein